MDNSTNPVSEGPTEPIAVVGLACRLPGADDAGGFWELLREGRSGVRAVPAHRPELGVSAGGSGRAGFLDHVDRFDAALFAVSPREAREMDPQQRLVLELAWAAVEDARIAPDSLRDGRLSE